MLPEQVGLGRGRVGEKERSGGRVGVLGEQGRLGKEIGVNELVCVV